MSGTAKLNCWQARACGRGPESASPCLAATDVASDGVNDGVCAGRICWTVPGADCFERPQGSFVDKLDTCLACDFFTRVKAEQGDDFRLLKLGQGVYDAPELHATISRIESFLRLHEDLHAEFDLRRLIDRIAAEAQRTVSAERSVVFLLGGDPPALRGEMLLRGERVPVTVPVDESSAVGSAALHNRSVNVRDPYGPGVDQRDAAPFDAAFDEQCGVRTQSLLAVPIRGSDGRPLGVVTAANSARGEFSPDDRWFMEQYALQAALALEKDRLLADNVFAGRLATFSETLAGLSHTLRGITHALRGLSYIIRHAVEAGRTQDIEAACEILDRQVERIVSLSRGVSEYDSQRGGEASHGELNEVVADVVRTLEGEAAARAVALRLELGEGLQSCACERVLVYRCLANLLSHALNSCALSGGEVVVRTRLADPGQAVIEVSHNGPGDAAPVSCDPEEWRDTCQAHTTRGIGLPTAIHLARALGGRLESGAAPDGGALYRVCLPVACQEAVRTSDTPTPR